MVHLYALPASAVAGVLVPEHAATIGTLIAMGIVSAYLGELVAFARKKYNVNYPIMYSTDKEGPGHAFNCIQRGHQNFLEGVPTFIVLLVSGSVYLPIPSAVAGMVFLLSRIHYAHLYATGPEKRGRASWGLIGLFSLLGFSGYTMWRLVNSA